MGEPSPSTAAHVLLINSARLVNIPAFVMDTGHGKQSVPSSSWTSRATSPPCVSMVAGADVLTQGYRGGSLERRGFGPDALAELRPASSS